MMNSLRSSTVALFTQLGCGHWQPLCINHRLQQCLGVQFFPVHHWSPHLPERGPHRQERHHCWLPAVLIDPINRRFSHGSRLGRPLSRVCPSTNTHFLSYLTNIHSARPWSYDNEQFTYPVMQLPSKTEKWIVKETVDGVEKEVEVEIGVYEEPKKLFYFAPKVVLQW